MNFEETNIIIDINDTDINNKKINKDETLLTDHITNFLTKEQHIISLKDEALKKQKQIHIIKQLLISRQTTPSCGLIIIDNFYNNALDTRNYVLTQDFSVKGNYPGNRTRSYANEHLKNIIQKYVEPFAGKITKFPIPKPDLSDADTIYNGAFQYTTSRDRSWVHTDGWNNWAGVLFLTPDAPLSSGTGFFRFQDGTRSEQDNKLLNNKKTTDTYSQDLTKWELVDRVGNVFNRLILFNSYNYHMSMDYFGDTKENGRLFQVFFFSTETEEKI